MAAGAVLVIKAFAVVNSFWFTLERIRGFGSHAALGENLTRRAGQKRHCDRQ
jgi:hypothetical protein